jgi:uncharacterized protein
MYVEIGPASLNVTAKRRGESLDLGRKWLEDRVWEILEEIGSCLPILKQKAWCIKKAGGMPEIPRTMIGAAKLVDEGTLTPMAAVAGAVSEALKIYVKQEAADFIAINNGGDAAIFSAGGKTVRAGIGDIGKGRETPYVLQVSGLADFGLATSGFGGRSFTLGLADAVTVIADSAAVADAAATFIANMTNVGTGHVTRKRAGEIDPASDIADELVTIAIGDLSRAEIAEALENGLAAARGLKERRIILDAVILLRNRMVTTIGSDGNIKMEEWHGSEKNSYGR